MPNAANIDKDVDWMMKNAEGFDVKIDHLSERYGELAVQGPEAETRCARCWASTAPI